MQSVLKCGCIWPDLLAALRINDRLGAGGGRGGEVCVCVCV